MDGRRQLHKSIDCINFLFKFLPLRHRGTEQHRERGLSFQSLFKKLRLFKKPGKAKLSDVNFAFTLLRKKRCYVSETSTIRSLCCSVPLCLCGKIDRRLMQLSPRDISDYSDIKLMHLVQSVQSTQP